MLAGETTHRTGKNGMQFVEQIGLIVWCVNGEFG